MRAARLHRYDESIPAKSLEIEEIEEPRVEGPFDVVVRVGAAGLCRTDIHIIEGQWAPIQDPDGTLLPYVLGHENAGWVEEVGSGVTNVSVGDTVILHPLMTCGLCRARSEEHTSELQSRQYLVCLLLLEKKKAFVSFIFCVYGIKLFLSDRHGYSLLKGVIYFLIIRRQPRSTLFPNTTLFRSENAGWVEEVGSGVTNVSVGDTVILHPLMTCGLCRACRAGDDMHCENGEFPGISRDGGFRSEEHTSELQSRQYLVCRLLLEKKKK